MLAQEIVDRIDQSVLTVTSLKDHVPDVLRIGQAVVECLRRGNKVLTAGNGGSASEAMHMAEELTGRFRTNRPSLPGISLASDATAITCIANDFGYDKVFSRQIEGLGKPGDILVLFSTSGNGANLDEALNAARMRGVKTICFLGRDGGTLAGKAEAEIVVRGSATERIQEAHQVLLHLVLDMVEEAFLMEGPIA